LSGGKGNDRLFGDFGDDTLQGGLGSDYFNCGDGTDNIIDYSDKEGDLQDNSCEIIN
jgi:Ca2+-binding RTX toxin-like protein